MRAAMRRTLAIVTTLVMMVSMAHISDAGASAKPKLNRTSATLEVGQTLTLKVKNLAKAKVKWSTAAKKIATVTKKGKVKAKSAGNTKITATIKKNKITYKLKCKVTVTQKGTRNVSADSEINTALLRDDLSKLVIKTISTATFTIPQGDYSNVDLVIDAPNAAVVNYGVFKSITIKSIKRESYTECASGNNIKVTSLSARIQVSQLGHPSSVSVESNGANVLISADGVIDNINVNGNSSYVVISAQNRVKNVTVNGTGAIVAVAADSNVDNVDVYAQAEVLMINNKSTDTDKTPETPGTTETPSTPDEPVESANSAKIGSTEYATLQAAIDSASTDTVTITLLKSVKEDIKIWPGNNITLDLNGYSIANKSKDSDTISLRLDAQLTIEGNGTIDNTGSGKAAVYNNGYLFLNGGTFVRSKGDADNDYYTIVNHGRLTIGGTATVGIAGQSYTLIQNGYTKESDYVSNVGLSKPTLILNGGTLNSGENSIENAIRGNFVQNNY